MLSRKDMVRVGWINEEIPECLNYMRRAKSKFVYVRSRAIVKSIIFSVTFQKVLFGILELLLRSQLFFSQCALEYSSYSCLVLAWISSFYQL